MLSGPYLHGAAVPSWGSLAVAHRKAADDHVRLLQAPGGAFGAGEPQVSVGWDRERACCARRMRLRPCGLRLCSRRLGFAASPSGHAQGFVVYCT